MQWTRADFIRGHAAELTYEIHDKYFDLGMIHYDEPARLWSLPIGDQKRGPYDKEIVVTGVTGFRIRDTERIRIYDIHSMRLDDARGVLRLKCNVPLGVWLSVAPDFRVTIIEAEGRGNASGGDPLL